MRNSGKKKPKLLLHICCGVCGVYISKLLKLNYILELFFYNPNIFPKKEYLKRLNEAKKIAKIYNLNLIIGEYKHSEWLKKIKGHEKDREGGERCEICYALRIKETALLAGKKGFDYFTTTLSVSPRKRSEIISRIGNNLSKKYQAIYLDRNFKKQDGFKKTIELSKTLDLYRQNYCGCEFSIRS